MDGALKFVKKVKGNILDAAFFDICFDRIGILYNLRANTRDFSHEIQPFLHIYFTNYYNIS